MRGGSCEGLEMDGSSECLARSGASEDVVLDSSTLDLRRLDSLLLDCLFLTTLSPLSSWILDCLFLDTLSPPLAAIAAAVTPPVM